MEKYFIWVALSMPVSCALSDPYSADNKSHLSKFFLSPIVTILNRKLWKGGGIQMAEREAHWKVFQLCGDSSLVEGVSHGLVRTSPSRLTFTRINQPIGFAHIAICKLVPLWINGCNSITCKRIPFIFSCCHHSTSGERRGRLRFVQTVEQKWATPVLQ